MKKKVLISGGSGLIGTRLSEMLVEKGYEVIWLSRSGGTGVPYKVVTWDISRGTLDVEALEGLEAVVHLAGAGVADERWTKKRKEIIMNSRTESTTLLMNRLSEVKDKPKVFIGASAIGYYGANTGNVPIDEESVNGSDFLARVVLAWERASDPVELLGIRRTLLRVGVVLSADGGALPEILAPLKWGFGAPLGSGNQWMSWIHIEDLCRLFVEAIENPNYNGTYNGVAPSPATNREVTKAAASVLNKPLWLPAVPGFALKLALGEMAQIVLGGSMISSKKVEKLGFEFRFPKLEVALKDILS